MLELYGGGRGMATPTVTVSNSCPADLHAVKTELSGGCHTDFYRSEDLFLAQLFLTLTQHSSLIVVFEISDPVWIIVLKYSIIKIKANPLTANTKHPLISSVLKLG